MGKEVQQALLRGLGTHAIKQFSMANGELKIVVAPWNNLSDEAAADFRNVDMKYIETLPDSGEWPLDFNLPWNLIRLDSNPETNNRWRIGICCGDINIGFVSDWPEISIVSTDE
ncbi:hypothetical protein [Vibrio sp. SCSIO 43136]|uniref:hypothetical protein n=1 Tax=Vibrio sp. SCSIO 43136 TaxID=2819101 RepID=UPI0020764E57|nr:hypothetical protein [Vibrio sp. SCSIO 43136]USD64288.1 hypothetical protein J4N39_09220 [Vibrio sp. SCSIO 43136]